MNRSAKMKLFQIVGTVALSVSAVASAMPDATVYPPATPSDRQSRFSLVGDIAQPGFTRLYVYDMKLGIFVDRYLISPGTAQFPTSGTAFRIDRAIILPTWTPPNSPWAAGMAPKPGGIGNPMGLLKMSLGQYSQYIHGIPKSEEPRLGTAASHGCLRMSSPNVLQLYQRYAGVGTRVTLNRDLAKSRAWNADFKARGMQSHPITDGSELVPGALLKQYPAVMEYHDGLTPLTR